MASSMRLDQPSFTSSAMDDVFMSKIIPLFDPFQRVQVSYVCRKWQDMVSRTWYTVTSITLDVSDLDTVAVLRHAGNHIKQLHLIIPENVLDESKFVHVFRAMAGYCSHTLIQLIVDCRHFYKFDLIPQFLEGLVKLEHIHWIFRGRSGQNRDSNDYEWDITDHLVQISIKIPTIRCLHFDTLWDVPLLSNFGFRDSKIGLETVTARKVYVNGVLMSIFLGEPFKSGKWSNLKVLRIPECSLEIGKLGNLFTKGQGLEIVDMSNCRFCGSVDTIPNIESALGALPNIKQLIASNIDFLLSFNKVVKYLSLGPATNNLTVLRLANAGITDSIGEHLGNLINLKELDLAENGLNDWALIPALSKLVKLETLHLCKCIRLKGTFLSTLTSCIKLQHVGLVGCTYILNSALDPWIRYVAGCGSRRRISFDVLNTGINLAHLFAEDTWHNLPLVLNFEDCLNSNHKHNPQIAPFHCHVNHNV